MGYILYISRYLKTVNYTSLIQNFKLDMALDFVHMNSLPQLVLIQTIQLFRQVNSP